MPQTRANKIQTPINGDSFPNFVNDLATMADTANVLIRVASSSERDALAGKSAGMAVTRTDLAGEPIEIYNGTSWDRQVSAVMQASTNFVGSGMTANDFTTGSKRPFWQFGTYVGGTDAAGNIAIPYTVAFPNGVITAVVSNGDHSTGTRLVFSVCGTPFTQTTSTLYAHVDDGTGNPKASTTLRFNWMAAGW